MRLFGLNIERSRAQSLASVSESRGGWHPLIRESFAGAWQKNVTIDRGAVLAHHAVFACQTLIASDVAKLRIKLMNQDGSGIWSETANAAYGPVLRKPNHFQNRIQFLETWILSKLGRGNTYALKQRDGRNVVVALYVLDPNRVWPLVADDGGVFYRLGTDNLSGLDGDVIVPARDIIHDRFNCLFHPLVGVSPIFANGLAAMQGLNIQQFSAWLFANRSQPGGVLTAPGRIDEATAKRIKEHWEQNFTGPNAGRVAVLGDALKYEKMALTAVEGQLIEQLKWSAEVVCSTYHVPPYKIGVGAMPAVTNIQALNVEYYSQCLQVLIEALELCLDEGLEMAQGYGTELDVDNLLRMDSVTQMTVLKEGVSASVLAPNEARRKIDLKPVPGGNSPMAQQQNFSLEALAKRDAQADPFATRATQPPASQDSAATRDDEQSTAAKSQLAAWALKRHLAALPARA